MSSRVTAGLAAAALAAVATAVPTSAGPPSGIAPTQWIAKTYTEALGRAPSQAEWQAAVDFFESGTFRGRSRRSLSAPGCTPANLETFTTGVFLSAEYAGLGYDAASSVLTLFRAVLNRDPDPASLESYAGLLAGGASWSAVVAAAFDEPEFTDADGVAARACGPDPAYGFGSQPAPVLPGVTGPGFTGGRGDQLQALLDAAAPGDTVWLAQKALVELDSVLVVPSGVTLATVGLPGPRQYAKLGRLVRASVFPAEAITLRPGARLDSVWVDGQRNVPPRVARFGVGTPSIPALSENGLGMGSYLFTARNMPGVTATINVAMHGGDIVNSVLTASQGWTAIQAGTVDGSFCTGRIAGNLITAYPSFHDTIFSDGVSNYCDDATIEYNEVVDTTDVGIIIFPPSSLLSQKSQVRYNVVISAGNSAYGAYAADGTLNNKTQPPLFHGAVVHDNLLWTSSRTHFDIGLAVGTRAWFSGSSATGFGTEFRRNTTGTLSARMATGIAVSGMKEVVVLDNTLTTEFADDASPCPRVAVGASVSAGHASGVIQPYTDVLIEGCIQTGDGQQ